MFVYVLNQHGKPLMPCRPAKARKLLKQQKAKVAKRTPFTIQLLYGSAGYKQPVVLGLDPGYQKIGLSATTRKRVLFEAEINCRSHHIVKLLADRAELRKHRRKCKTRYRKRRPFRRKQKGSLLPSVRHRLETHVKAVNLAASLLPISKIIVEVAQFDIQKIKNPEIKGVEYQQGEQFGFSNVREYVLARDNHTCQAKKGCRNKILTIHHVESSKTGGNSPENLITLCKDCHKAYHRGELDVIFRRGRSFREAAAVNELRWRLLRELERYHNDVGFTYGFVTKNLRIHNKLAKNHRTDARCIGGNPNSVPDDTWYLITQVRGQDRQLHKANPKKGGVRRVHRLPRYVFGFQLFDKVLYNGQEFFVRARGRQGYFKLGRPNKVLLNGVSYKKLKVVERVKGTFIYERRRVS